MSLFNLVIDEKIIKYQATNALNHILLHTMCHFTDMLSAIVQVWTHGRYVDMKYERPAVAKGPFLDRIILQSSTDFLHFLIYFYLLLTFCQLFSPSHSVSFTNTITNMLVNGIYYRRKGDHTTEILICKRITSFVNFPNQIHLRQKQNLLSHLVA